MGIKLKEFLVEQKKKFAMIALSAVMVVSMLSGCATTQHSQEIALGAVVGAGTGAVVGIATNSNDVGRDLVIGGLAGAMGAATATQHNKNRR